jgi:hypothetical protein
LLGIVDDGLQYRTHLNFVDGEERRVIGQLHVVVDVGPAKSQIKELQQISQRL